jgi:hypothetical protein
MATQYPDLFAALARPFDPTEVKQRPAPGGRQQLHYITARTAMNRLDLVLGPENWWDEFSPLENSVVCKLSIRLPDGQVVTKADAGGYAGMADQGDDDKSGFSDAFKRAAAKFGVARYLYRDGVPDFSGEGRPTASAPASHPTSVPTPASDNPPRPEPNGHHPTQPARESSDRWAGKAPTSGKGLFAWIKDREKEHNVNLLKYLNNWAKLQELPDRMVDWDDEAVALGYAEACRKLGIEAVNTGAKGPGAEEVRQKLMQMVWEIARAQHGQNPTDQQWWQVMADLDVLVDDGNVVSDVMGCKDAAKLSRYLEAARTKMEFAGEGR